MERFLALFHRRAAEPAAAIDRALRALKTPWRAAIEAPGALVLCRNGEAYGGTDAGGRPWVIIGTMFDACGAAARASAVAALAREPGLNRNLVSQFWGRYVAIVGDAGGERWTIMRDPSGRMPCQAAIHHDWALWFSHLEDALASGWRPTGVDWDFLAAHLQDPRIRDGRTGFQNVRELTPGEAADTVSAASRTVWSPVSFARAGRLRDNQAAQRDVRQAVLTSVRAWASRHRRILHLLSGGLDSTLVLACLARARTRENVLCLTFTRGRNSELDETRYARMAAAASGVELIERTLEPTKVRIEPAVGMTCATRPSGYLYSIENDALEWGAARAWGADGCFSAAGGDGLFFQLRANVFCADYLFDRGLRPELTRIALDSARLTRTSVWRTLGAGFNLAYGEKTFDPLSGPRNPYLHEDLGDPGRGWLNRHPWFAGAEELAPGKRLHLWALLDCLNLFYPYRRAALADTVLPLVSQPIIETVLQIPSYVLSSGGADRTLVRGAFAGIAPAAILARRSKGAMDGYYAELCAANLGFIRERLLGGVMAARGLLNRARLEQDMPRRGEPADGAEPGLLKLLAAELWASAWSPVPRAS